MVAPAVKIRDLADRADKALLMARRELARRRVVEVDSFLEQLDKLLDEAEALFRDGDPERGTIALMAAKIFGRKLAGLQDLMEKRDTESVLNKAREASERLVMAIDEMLGANEYGAFTRRAMKAAPDTPPAPPVIQSPPAGVKTFEPVAFRLACLVATVSTLVALVLAWRGT